MIISVLEGNPTFCDIEKEFNVYFGTGWRRTARVVGTLVRKLVILGNVWR